MLKWKDARDCDISSTTSDQSQACVKKIHIGSCKGITFRVKRIKVRGFTG